MIPYHAVLYMQTPYDSLSFSALYAKCPYVLVLYMQSALFLSALHANLSGGGAHGWLPALPRRPHARRRRLRP